MAILQISRVQNRKGLQTDLPQLAGAELGWSVDQRRLWIGNGTIQEGAPVVGNTEILTEFSNILDFAATYTYKGQAAGYTVQTGPGSAPITQSLQSRLDSFAVVTDFGAVGDGVTDDTLAINRALEQLYCRQNNVQVRRGLFFPAGVYLISETILIPPYAYLYGEGAQSSIIQLTVSSDISSLNAYVARTSDNHQQSGVNIGTNGATPPQEIVLQNLGFHTQQLTDILLVEACTNMNINNCSFQGPLTSAQVADPLERGDIAGVRFNSTASLITTNINIAQCVFSNTTYGSYTGELVQGAAWTDCIFNNHYQGIVWGGPTVDPSIGGPKGCAVLHSVFDNVYAQGIVMDGVSLNISGYNSFFDVGNHFGGDLGSPFTPVIDITANNNVSVGDMFARSDSATLIYPRVSINGTATTVLENGSRLRVGQYQRQAGLIATLNGGATNNFLFQVETPLTQAFRVDYTFIRNSARRLGYYTVIANPSTATQDDFTENQSTGLTLSVSQVGTTVTVSYSTTAGVTGLLHYSLVHLD